MPPVVAAIGLVQSIITVATAIKITAGMVLGLVGNILGFVLSVASFFGSKPKPKAQEFKRETQERNQLVRSSISPHRWIYGTAKVSGVVTYGTSTGAGKQYLHFVVTLAGHEVAGIDDIWINEYRITNDQIDGNGDVTAGDLSGLVRVKKYLGLSEQVADPDLIAEAPNSEWTSAHRLRSRAYVYLRVKFDDNKFRGGLQNVNALVRGWKVYDPRTGTTAHSDNAALCILHYVRQRPGVAVPDSEIDMSWWSAQANLADELVETTVGGSTQKRYRLNGSFTLDQQPIAVLEDLLSACAGTMIDRAGKYWLYAAAWTDPTGTLDENDFVGPIRVRWNASLRESFNGVRGTYVDPNKEWMPGDFPIYKNNTYIAADGGEEVLTDIDLTMVTDPYQAQRLAKITLESHRQAITFTAKCRRAVARFAAMETVLVTHSYHGWTNKPFRIVTAKLNDDFSVDVTFREEATTTYSWNAGETVTVDAAPNSSLYLPTSVFPPGGLSIEEQLYETRDGAGVKTKAILSWGAAPDPYIRHYEVYYRETSSPDWIFVGSPRNTYAEIEDLAPGAYDFQVRAVNILDFASAYVTVSSTLDGLLGPPTAPQDLSIQQISSLALLRWTQVPDIDVRIGGRIEVRHSPLTAGASWENSTSIASAISGRETLGLVPLKPGTYLLKSVDSSGIYSSAASSVTTDGAVVLPLTDAATPLQEDATFPGAKTNCAVSGSNLQLTGTTLWDDIAVNIDSVTELIDNMGGQALVGTYVFATTVSLGSVKKVQLRSHVRATIVNSADTIDGRTEMVDSWVDFDGSVGARGDVVVYARTTPDDPAGSPTWSGWFRCDVTEVLARGIQFKADLTVDDKVFNVQVSELRAYVKELL